MAEVNNEVKYTLSLNDMLSENLRNADSNANKFEGTLSDVQNKLEKIGIGIGIAFAVNKLKDFGMTIIENGSKVENAVTGLTTLLKDHAAAVEVVNNTMKDATTTPFAFEGLLSANKSLISAGISADNARKDVLNLANAIAATGGGDEELQRMVVNLQGISNTGKATAMDIRQFATAGVNIYQVLENAGISVKEDNENVAISYQQISMALAKAHAEGGIFYNGLENMAGNTSVQISNLGDSFFQLTVKMFNDLKPAIDAIIGVLGDMIKGLRDGWDWLVKNKGAIENVTIAVMSGVAAAKIYQLWTERAVIWSAIKTTAYVIETGVLTALGTAVEFVNAAFLASPIGWIVIGVTAIVAAVIYCWNHFAKFRAVLMGVWEFMKAFFEWVAFVPIKILMALGEMVIGALTLNPTKIAKGFEDAKSVIFDGAKNLATSFKKGYNEGMESFAKDQEISSNSPATVNVKGIKDKPTTPPTNKPTEKVVGNKSISISIKIDSLIKQQTISVKNMVEGAAKTKDMVQNALTSAISDSQIIAGQ